MRPLLTPEEMRRADEAAIAGGPLQTAVPADVLMDRAGRAVARAATRLAGGRYGRRFVVVCGKGNNGGDGFVAARALHAAGLSVRCILLDDSVALRGAALHHYELMVGAGVRTQPFERAAVVRADVIVDAIFGTGFKGRPEGVHERAIDAIGDSNARVVAADIPSGVNGETGAVDGSAVRADVTVAMAAEKIGTRLMPGSVHAGAVDVARIGILVNGNRAGLIEAGDVSAWLPRRAPDAHKGSSGTLAVLAGSDGIRGAALLTARAGVRSGVGYLRLGCPEGVRASAAGRIPEALVSGIADELLGAEALDRFAGELRGSDAAAIGPGIGKGPGQRALVEKLLATFDKPIVVDADALNVLAEDPGPLVDRRPVWSTVITPHPGEMARLLGCKTADVQADRPGAAREAAARFDCMVVLKGAPTLIAVPEREMRPDLLVSPTGGPELAAGGSGDVLTGVIGAFLAEGVFGWMAVAAAVFVHGAAGALARRAKGGDVGVTAWDVAEALPEAIGALTRDVGPFELTVGDRVEYRGRAILDEGRLNPGDVGVVVDLGPPDSPDICVSWPHTTLCHGPGYDLRRTPRRLGSTT